LIFFPNTDSGTFSGCSQLGQGISVTLGMDGPHSRLVRVGFGRVVPGGGGEIPVGPGIKSAVTGSVS
jgi:hypothetical protein